MSASPSACHSPPLFSSPCSSKNSSFINGTAPPSSLTNPHSFRSSSSSASVSFSENVLKSTNQNDIDFLAPLAIRLSPAVDVTNLSFHINPPPTDRPVRIYCDGIFDLFHYGHARCLEQAKGAFESVFLIVGVCNDDVTHKYKGKTVMNEIERFESLRHCNWVDKVIEGAPWIITEEFIDEHEIDYVAHDNIPYASSNVCDIYDFVKKQGKFLPTRRTEGISTSDLITRIVRDYDEYLRRNLARGVTPKELNIGFFKEKQLMVEKSVKEIKDEIKSELAELRGEWKETYRFWEERSSHYIKGFVELFRNGPELVAKFLRINSRSIGKKRRAIDEDNDASDTDSRRSGDSYEEKSFCSEDSNLAEMSPLDDEDLNRSLSGESVKSLDSNLHKSHRSNGYRNRTSISRVNSTLPSVAQASLQSKSTKADKGEYKKAEARNTYQPSSAPSERKSKRQRVGSLSH